MTVPNEIHALRERFLDAISDHSEATWCAGWMSGIEQEVRREAGLWLLMAAACQGWPQGYRGEDGWEPLTSEERAMVLSLVEHCTNQEPS